MSRSACVGGNRNEVGKVGYLIGNKYDQYGKQELAVKYHNEFLEICKTTKDDLGMGKACQALAYANQRYFIYACLCVISYQLSCATVARNKLHLYTVLLLNGMALAFLLFAL